MRPNLIRSTIVAALMLVMTAPAALAQKETKEPKVLRPGTPRLWKDPGDVSRLDFVYGSAGRARAPKPPFTFVEEDLDGSNPKLKIKDANGVSWGVKFGSEVNAEVFASRIAWAAGYFVEPAFFVKSGKIQGVTGLGRAKRFVGSDGSFQDARFELKEKGYTKFKDEQSWRWDTNPFAGTKELAGLKLVLLLTSNWDSKDQRDTGRGSNTAIWQAADGDQWYVFSDWGGSMGKWGGVMSREKWDCKGYSAQTPKFIKGVRNGTVEFGYSGQRRDVTEGIKVSDVQWLMGYLGRLSDEQIRAGLEASGATPDEVSCFTAAFRDRLDQLKSVR
jgi:hypothetical protein